VWTAGVVATLLARPGGLAFLRVASLAVAFASAVVVVMVATSGPCVCARATAHSPAPVAVALAAANGFGLVGVAFAPSFATWAVNGPAYPNERRFLLATPAWVLLGPLPAAWVVLVGGPAAAVTLLAGGRWLAGGGVAAVAAPAAFVAGRAVYGLARRWVVFVPAGLVLHDPITLADPVLFRREVIERLGPAAPDSDSLDLSVNALGLALELVLTEKVPLVIKRRGGRTIESGASARLLFTPTRPGAVLAEAAKRRIAIGAPSDDPGV
jgi:hypothetical protein